MKRSYTFEQYLFIAGIYGLFFWMLTAFLQPLLLGFLLALVLYPYHLMFQRKLGLPKKLSTFLLTLLLTICVLLPFTYIAIVVTNDVIALTRYLSNFSFAESGESLHLGGLLDTIQTKLSGYISFPRQDVEDGIRRIVTTVGSLVAGWVTVMATSLPSIVLNGLLFLFALFFGLSDGPALVEVIKRVLPFEAADIKRYLSTTDKISRGVVLGSLLSGLIQGTIVGLTVWLMQVPRPLFFGTMTFLFSFIPFVGALPICVGTVIYLFAIHRAAAAVGMIFIYIVVLSVDNIVKPLMLKGQTSIHPFLALISVMGGIVVFGVSGIFLGPLLAALALVSVDVLVGKKGAGIGLRKRTPPAESRETEYPWPDSSIATTDSRINHFPPTMTLYSL